MKDKQETMAKNNETLQSHLQKELRGNTQHTSWWLFHYQNSKTAIKLKLDRI